MKKPLLNLSLAVTSLLLLSMFVEVGARVAGWGETMEFVPNDKWGYTMRPSHTVRSYGYPIVTNRHGLRGPDFKKHRKENTTRILYVGDSVTYGGGKIPEADLFCRRTETALNESGRRVEIVNASAPGWSPQNWIEFLEGNGLFGAEIVVLILPECDLARAFATIDTYRFQERAPRLNIHSIAMKLYAVIAKPRRGRRPGLRLTTHENVSRNVDAVVRLADLCREQGAELLTVFVPSIPSTADRQYWPPFESVVNDPLDLREHLTDPAFFMDGVHLSVTGHEIAGADIAIRLLVILESQKMAGRVSRKS